MINISLCMIVKNEEEVLGRCLDSIKEIVDEIIIIDTGSNDKTKEVAKIYTPYVYDLEWVNDFSKARNYAFSKATKEYVMWLDADDIILEKDKEEFLKLKKTIKSETEIVMMKYDVAFDENGKPTFSYYRERILKRDKNYQWKGRIHEVISLDGNIMYSDIAISHKKIHINDPKRNLNIFNQMIREGEKLSPREQFYYARELYYNKEYKKAVKEFDIFLESKDGWIENNIEACLMLSKCHIALEEKEKSLVNLFKSFIYDKPRAEVCCEIGKIFFEEKKHEIAIYWYEKAILCDKNEKNGGFILLDCYGYIPYIQLCVCYDRLGNREKAIYCNNKAGEIKPNDKAYLYNKKYFESLS